MGDILSMFGLTFHLIGIGLSFAPYWLPFVLGYVFWELWMRYVQMQYLSDIKWVLIGIRLPKNIMKTPLSMELVISALHQPSQGTWLDRIWKGRLKSSFSLEIASLGGDIHFYIRTPEFFKNYIEAQLYSQFPGIELYDAEDYTNLVSYSPNDPEWEMWGTEYKFVKPDPYPIKTYVDYKLDTAMRREEEAAGRTDPLSPAIEFMGSISRNEQIWFQIMVRSTSKRYRVPGTWFATRDWKGEAKDLLKKLQSKGEGEKMSKAESEAAAAIEREITKFGFDCGIRAIYLGRAGAWTRLNVSGMIGMMKHYNSEALNGFKPQRPTAVDYPWEGILWNTIPDQKERMFKAYCARGYFYSPFKRKLLILNTEELATMYHFPAGMAETPGFLTVSSHKAEPPANLPV
ncbi:MAG: hypothetical protein WCT49_05710 [Candidatus Paceibacterota bacterium]